MKSSNKKSKTSKKQSAGILMYSLEKDTKTGNYQIKYFLVHPGGPFWAKKNEGAWTIPKGEFEEGEEIIETAKREMLEETGIEVKEPIIELGWIKQKSGKIVYAWAFEGEYSGVLNCTSTVEIEYPPKSGKIINIPEVDKGGMFTKEEAKKLINPAQFEFIEKLESCILENYIK